MAKEHFQSAYDELLDTITSGVAVYSVINEGSRGSDYIVLDFNRAALALEGKTRQEVVGRSLVDLRPNIDNFGLIPIFRQVWLTGEPAFYPARVYIDNTFANYYENRVFRLSENRIAAVYNDVTARMEAERSLRESETLLGEVLDSMEMAIAIYDPVDDGDDFVFVRMNKGAEPVTHYRCEEVVGRRISELFPGEASVGLIAKLKEAWLTGETVHIPLKQYKDNRITQWVENTIFKLPSGRVVAMFEDTCAQRMAEQALRESEARYRLAQRIGNMGSWEYDLQKEEFWGSDEAKRIYGFDPADVAFSVEQVESRIPERERVHRALVDLIDHDAPYDLEFDVLPLGDGPPHTINSIAQLVRDENGVPLKVAGLIRDITEKASQQKKMRELQRRFEQSQRLDSVGQLAGGIAHDFNNLLSVILTYTEFALEALPEDGPIADDLLNVKNAGERAATLTRQLLAFSRRQILQPVELDLNQIAMGLERMLQRILGEDINYVQHLAPDLGLVRTDPGQMEQVLMNLVLNARDAMPEGGTLSIETGNVSFCERSLPAHPTGKIGDFAMISVADSGCGMDEQTITKIFEPFYTTKAKGKGTGLGLSTVYGIVAQSEGDITVASMPGRGTTFTIYLPRLLQPDRAGSIPAAIPHPTTGSETILLVEDEPALRRVAERALREAGYTLITAGNGEEAMLTSQHFSGPIHLLLTDVVMPQMGGRVLAERLIPTRPGMRVLYMSGYTDDTIVRHGIRDEHTHFLAKPFTAIALRDKVRELLDCPIEPRRNGLQTDTGR